MADIDVDVPVPAFPLRLRPDGTLAVVQQDSLEDVRACVHMQLLTPLGSRPLAPDFGVDDPTFTGAIDADELAAALEDGDDRASVTVSVEPGAMGDVDVRVDVALADDLDAED